MEMLPARWWYAMMISLFGKSGWRSGHQSRLPPVLQMLYVGWVSVDLKLTSWFFPGHSGFLPPQYRLPLNKATISAYCHVLPYWNNLVILQRCLSISWEIQRKIVSKIKCRAIIIYYYTYIMTCNNSFHGICCTSPPSWEYMVGSDQWTLWFSCFWSWWIT